MLTRLAYIKDYNLQNTCINNNNNNNNKILIFIVG